MRLDSTRRHGCVTIILQVTVGTNARHRGHSSAMAFLGIVSIMPPQAPHSMQTVASCCWSSSRSADGAAGTTTAWIGWPPPLPLDEDPAFGGLGRGGGRFRRLRYRIVRASDRPPRLSVGLGREGATGAVLEAGGRPVAGEGMWVRFSDIRRGCLAYVGGGDGAWLGLARKVPTFRSWTAAVAVEGSESLP